MKEAKGTSTSAQAVVTGNFDILDIESVNDSHLDITGHGRLGHKLKGTRFGKIQRDGVINPNITIRDLVGGNLERLLPALRSRVGHEIGFRSVAILVRSCVSRSYPRPILHYRRENQRGLENHA